jgi:hypothetical protein
MVARSRGMNNLSRLALAAATCLLACSSSPSSTAEPVGQGSLALEPPACTVDPERELLVLDVSVVEDGARAAYPGAWSFGHLIENMVGAHDRDTFVRRWFAHWDRDQIVNGFTVPAKPTMREDILDPWIAKSRSNGVSGLDMRVAPFRLLGIANRLDLMEGRFIFGFINVLGDPKLGTELRMGTMIMEYQLPATGCEQVKKWAKAWHALGSFKLGSSEYNAALQEVTESFAGADIAPGRPNGSALKQLRTNEFMAEGPWQWRQFELSAATGLLEQSTVSQTPATEVNHSARLADYVNANERAILGGAHVVPATYQGKPFLGGSSDGDPVSLFFSAPGIRNNEARHRLSMTTCAGCHTTETPTAFFQVGPRNLGHRSFASLFLTGGSSADPVDPKVVRSFNDLDRRAKNVCRVLASSCSDLEDGPTLARVH